MSHPCVGLLLVWERAAQNAFKNRALDIIRIWRAPDLADSVYPPLLYIISLFFQPS